MYVLWPLPYQHLAEDLSLLAPLEKATGEAFHLITDRADFSLENLENLAPQKIFLPHWSYLVPRDIFERFECIVFHMTDLPFGRGGSPLQNLISRGIYSTILSALRCEEEVDAGPVYLKKPLSLHGTAEEIYARGGRLVESMILEIIDTDPEPKAQEGKIVTFKRRKPEESNLAGISNPTRIYDHIRMLDADGYPHAFLEAAGLRLEFTAAELKDEEVTARVRIVPLSE